MKHGASESSDVTSQATTTTTLSPPRAPKTPKRLAYYMQRPSRDAQSHDEGDKQCSSTTTTAHITPVYNNSPLDSPSHPSTSRVSSATRLSGTLVRSSSPASSWSAGAGAAAAGRKRLVGSSNKGWWREVSSAIDEEEAAGSSYDELDQEQERGRERERREVPRYCAVASWLAVLALAFGAACLVVWAAAARHYKPTVLVKSLTVHNFYAGEGTDRTGVPTKLVTLNCSLAIAVHNPSTMFGIHVSSSSIRLMYSEIAIANGQLQRFYQPRTSRRVAAVFLHGEKTPLYGAGATLAPASPGARRGSKVPLTLELAVRTRGYVMGGLVGVTHRRRVRCPVAVDPGSSRPVRFRQSACSYR